MDKSFIIKNLMLIFNIKMGLIWKGRMTIGGYTVFGSWN